MITGLRGMLNTWVAKALFVVLIISFAIWGVGDVVRGGRDTTVATVGTQTIQATELEEALRREVAQVARMLQGRMEITPDMRRLLADQALERLIGVRAVESEAAARGMVVSDAALRQAVFEIEAFRGLDGRFDRRLFDRLMAQNNLTEPRFLALLASDLRQRQLVSAARAGAVAPVSLVRGMHRFENEQRVVDSVSLPFADAPEPEPPTEAALRRFHENNADRFSTPEFRRIAAAILTPDALLAEVQVSEAEIEAAYVARRATYVQPERRTVELVAVADAERAAAIAATWRGGADFAAIQAAASEAGGTAIELSEQTRTDLPFEELRGPVFAAAAGEVLGPIETPLGPQLVRVATVLPPVERPLAEVREEVRIEAAREKAIDLVYARANRVEDALASGVAVAEVARDQGLMLVQAVVDRQGNGPDGTPLAVPGGAPLRAAVLGAAFSRAASAAPELTEVGTASYHVVSVIEVIAPTLRPFQEVEEGVRAAFLADARRRHQETRAAALLGAVRDGKPFPAAAEEAGLTVARSDAFSRRATPEGLPRPVVETVFGQSPGEVTMAETATGFVVASLVEVREADPDADLAGFARARDQLAGAIGTELEAQFIAAIRARAAPQINRTVLEQVVGQ